MAHYAACARFTVAFGLCLGISSCSIGLGPPEVTSGREIDIAKVEGLPDHATAGEVLVALGKPNDVLTNAVGEETWRYVECGEQDDIVRFFGAPAGRRPIARWKVEVRLVLIGGILFSKQVARENLLDPDHEPVPDDVCFDPEVTRSKSRLISIYRPGSPIAYDTTASVG